MSLDQLDAHEDVIDDDDLSRLRAQRLADMKAQSRANRFGQLYQVGQTDYKTAITDASHASPVVVHLMEHGSQDCALLNQCLGEVARRFPAVKFVRVVASEAMEKFPRQNCPTVLVYRNGQIVGQFVKLSAWAGPKTNADVVEWVLAKQVPGLLPQSTLESDPRAALVKTSVSFAGRSRAGQAQAADSDDDDW